MSFTEQLREFLDGLDESVGAEALADALQEVHQAAYQAIYDRGHGGATSRLKSDIEDLEGKLSKEQKRRKKAEERAEQLEEENPEVGEIRSQYEEQLEETREEYEERLRKQGETLNSERRQRARSDLVAMLSGELDRDYAEVQVDRVLSNGRIRHDDEGEIEVLQDGKDIPIQADKPLEALASEITESADPKWRVSKADSGSGTQGSGAAGSGGSNRYDRIREKAKKERENARSSGPPAAERMGIAE